MSNFIIYTIYGASFGVILGLIQSIKRVVRWNKDAIEYKLIGESAKLQDEIKLLKLEIIASRQELAHIQNLFGSLSIKMIEIQANQTKTPMVHQKPANRNRRTEEQKRQASERRRAWWAAKKERDANKKAQELNVPTPRLQGELEANVS